MNIVVKLNVIGLLLGLSGTSGRVAGQMDAVSGMLTKRNAQGCRPVSSADSANFVNLVRDNASSATDRGRARAIAMLPLASADSVHPITSATVCDTAAVHYRAAFIAASGNSNTPLLPMRLVRVSSNRIVGDPAVVGGPGNKPEYVTFDSTFSVVKIWHAGP